MTFPCDNCPLFYKCRKPCATLKEMIPKVIDHELLDRYREEIPVSQTQIEMTIKANDSKKVATIDHLRKINLGASFAADTDQTAIWDDNEPIQGIAKHDESDSDPAILKKINECIKNAVPKIKDRRQYRAYLGCDKITAIAKRAGVSKQTIQKQFSRITDKISEMYKKRYNAVVSDNPFKLKKAGGACRIELKK